jgi:methylated-DNA-protein-cysteine methyltransferase-like protein
VNAQPDEAFTQAVIAVVEAVPPGEISTYGEIAAEAGYPGAARAVGNLLRSTPGLPWWRVIAASGRLVPGLEKEHAQRLRAEGISVVKGKVRMKGST